MEAPQLEKCTSQGYKEASCRVYDGQSHSSPRITVFQLLTLDLIIIVIFSLMIGSVYEMLSKETADLLVMFTFPIFALSGGLQGIISLIFVPYLRSAFIQMLKGKKNEEGPPSGSFPRTVSVVKATL